MLQVNLNLLCSRKNYQVTNHCYIKVNRVIQTTIKSKSIYHSLSDNKLHTYWQASDNEKCAEHWILIDLKENIKLSSLSIHTIGNRNDDLLKTVNIEVKIGNAQKIETVVSKCDYILTLKNDYLLCSCFPTDQKFTYLKIIMKRNLTRSFPAKTNNLIKIKSIKLMGKQEAAAEKTKATVTDACICWYFEMISSMALMQSQLMPGLVKQVLNMTR